MSDYNKPQNDNKATPHKSEHPNDKSGNLTNEKRAEDGNIQQHGKLANSSQPSNPLDNQSKGQQTTKKDDKEQCSTDAEHKSKK